MTGSELTIAAMIGAIVLAMLYFVFFRLSSSSGRDGEESADALVSLPKLRAAEGLSYPDEEAAIEVPCWEPATGEHRQITLVQESLLRAAGPGGGAASTLRQELALRERYQSPTRLGAELELSTVRTARRTEKDSTLFADVQVKREADGSLVITGAPEASDPEVRTLLDTVWQGLGKEDPIRRAIAEQPVQPGKPISVDSDVLAAFLDVDHVTDFTMMFDGLDDTAASFRLEFRVEDRTLFGRYWQERTELLVLERKSGRPLGYRWSAEQGSRLGVLFLALRSGGFSCGVVEYAEGRD